MAFITRLSLRLGVVVFLGVALLFGAGIFAATQVQQDLLPDISVSAVMLPGPLQPLIPKVIAGANNALALAIGDLFWITIVAGVLGLTFTLILRDLPLRSAAELRGGAAPSGGDGQVAAAESVTSEPTSAVTGVVAGRPVQ